jgi:hypothetical protein
MVINALIKKLLQNVEKNSFKLNYSTGEVDLVIDGGAFNGSYVIGSLYYFKEMEKQKYLKINRISGCSVGALCGFLFFINKLDEGINYYKMLKNSFQVNNDLRVLYEWFDNFKVEHLTTDMYKLVSNRLTLTYFDTNLMKTIIRDTYTSNDDLIDCLIKTSFIPYIGNGDFSYNKCIDGGIPHLIKPFMKNQKLINNKIIYIHLTSVNRILKCFVVKNEVNGYERIFDGIHLTHNFFFKKKDNDLITCVNDWPYYNYGVYYLQQLCLLIIYYILIYTKKYIEYLPYDINSNEFISELSKIGRNLFYSYITKFCFN